LPLALAVPLSSATPPIKLTPKFVAGETLVYAVQSTTNTVGATVAPIHNPEVPSQSSLSINLRARLEVLSLDTQPEGASVRMRVTWESAHASFAADAIDPAAPNREAPYNKLEGQSLELTLAPGGALKDFKGLEDVEPGGVPPADAVAWIAALVAADSFPADGIAVGRQWKAERPIAGAPLAGLFWRTQSTYQRDEPCQAGFANVAPAESCAVIMSEMTIARRGSSHADATPDDYLRNGLRTFGTWSGSEQEIGSISLATGLLVTATETSTQSMDYTIKSAASGSSVRYTAKVESRMGITLVASSGTQGSAHP